MNIKIITTASEFTELKNGWTELLEKSEDSQVFYTWEWMNTYIQNLLTNEEKLFIILAEEAGKYVTIAPLKIKYKTILLRKKRMLTNLTDSTTDYNSIIMDQSYNYKKLLEKIVDTIQANSDQWDIMRLINLNERSYLPQNLYEILTSKQFSNVAIYVNTVCPYLKYSDIEVKRSKKQMKNILRQKRRLEKNSNIEICLNEKFDVEIFHKLVEFKNKTHPHSTLKDSRVVNFYIELSKIIPEKIHFSYIKSDEEVIAIYFGFKDKNKIYYYMASYDLRHANTGAGLILLKDIIDSEEKNVELFDFLKGNYRYKFFWADRMTFNYDIWTASSTKGNFIIKLYINLFVLFKTIPWFKNLHKYKRGH